MLALQGYYDKMNEEQEEVDKSARDASANQTDEEEKVDSECTNVVPSGEGDVTTTYQHNDDDSVVSTTSSQLRAHFIQNITTASVDTDGNNADDTGSSANHTTDIHTKVDMGMDGQVQEISSIKKVVSSSSVDASVSISSSATSKDGKEPIQPPLMVPLLSSPTVESIYSARSQADEETDEFKQTLIDNYVKKDGNAQTQMHTQMHANGMHIDDNSRTHSHADVKEVATSYSHQRRGGLMLDGKQTEHIRSIHTIVSKYNHSIATAVLCSNVFKVTKSSHLYICVCMYVYVEPVNYFRALPISMPCMLNGMVSTFATHSHIHAHYTRHQQQSMTRIGKI